MIQIPAGNEVLLKKKMRIKPTYTVHDLNRNKTNFKCKQEKKNSNFLATFSKFSNFPPTLYSASRVFFDLPRLVGKRKKTLLTASSFFDLPLIQENG